MVIKPNDYILGYWFASNEIDTDWYCMVVKEGNQWVGEHTFRSNKSTCEDPFSGEDEKQVTRFKSNIDESEEDVLKRMELLFNSIKVKFKTSDSFLVQGTFEKFRKIAETKQYLHMKVIPVH